VVREHEVLLRVLLHSSHFPASAKSGTLRIYMQINFRWHKMSDKMEKKSEQTISA